MSSAASLLRDIERLRRGRYLPITTNGPRGYSEIPRWALGERRLADLAAGAFRAVWV